MDKVNAIDIANYFVVLASHIDENDLTNLKLQKLLYFAQGKYIAQYKNPIFDEEIEAWALGPVVKNVYSAFKSCGNFPITVFDVPAEPQNISQQLGDFLNKIWEDVGKFSASFLVKQTHKPNTPWNKFYQEGENNIIPKAEIGSYFKSNDI
ncbi:MAG: Prophage ps3 protein 01 [candidate division CPR2 bacterium GW2011_GWC1_41_48]|uniref:Prophage ps3 protein 01 n=1 Tax=candidate division CPR2 bacterium GW2011_GWC1_41_48 TaxID=1618344 RepID=A0A0G0Z8R7_UNCC2|nr:MAG: Prophage ps3 protein 01 [candidate division CPR2 bacterium GW2011_GWC2_39_35]KKR27571.1 MAG: Prophage ps3 protein 01 [candidate division CPR2 bacterium GW2011_GWD2_39_7]KKR29586.1 MAG: Prophage ps3 protein 01 [candidate division CPR2 bacterium GW2011_GWD1_39_7]KKS09443.1 MAG: Prophage ps3 protein 01 [candidate division CPR2 bacterium GW2011_GWC1_41_48]OGB55908.1 MAG: hypothetical protein A2Y27_00690 [candidate division CPR2 bacterium GWD1_39_7]OGB71522.1 MAG: hypothetical protein A2Y26